MDTCHIHPINAETLAVFTLNFNIYLQYCPWAFSIKYFLFADMRTNLLYLVLVHLCKFLDSLNKLIK